MADGWWLGIGLGIEDRVWNWGIQAGELWAGKQRINGSTDHRISAGTLSLIDCPNVENPLSRAETGTLNLNQSLYLFLYLKLKSWSCSPLGSIVDLQLCNEIQTELYLKLKLCRFDVEVEVFRAPPIDSQFHGAHWFWSATTGAPAGRLSAPATPPPLKSPFSATPLVRRIPNPQIPRFPSRRKFYWQRQLAARASRIWDRSQWVADEYSLLALVWIKWIKSFLT